MFRTKFSIGVLLAIILLATQVFVAGAAPARQDSTPITGTVNNIEFQTNPDTLETTVLVTIANDTGTQTLELSLDTAIGLGLVLLDPTDNTPSVNLDSLNDSIVIDPTTVLNPEPTEETIVEEQHPVGSALSDFFSDALGVDYEMVMGVHEEGVGFGVIAQALWMTNVIEGNTTTFENIILAKQNKDFRDLGITLPDGSEPTNWGQFRKAVMSDREKAKENLGAIMSGRAEKPGDETLLEEGMNTKSNNGKGIGNGNNGKNESDDPFTLENENNGKNITNGVGPNGIKENNGNSSNNKNKDKSNNGKNKNK